MKQNNISAVLCIILVGLSFLIYKCSSRNKEGAEISTSGNSSFIGRKSDTIKVFANEPSNVKIAELVKINGRWCLNGDTTSTVDNVEIIQVSKVGVSSLTYTYKGKEFTYKISK